MRKYVDEDMVRNAVLNALEAAREADPEAKDIDLLRSTATGPNAIYKKYLHELYLLDTTKNKGSYGDIAPCVKKIREQMIAAAEEEGKEIAAPMTPVPPWLDATWGSCIEALLGCLSKFRASIAAEDEHRCISLQRDADAKVAAGLIEARKRIATCDEEIFEAIELAGTFERERDEAVTRADELSRVLGQTQEELSAAKERADVLAHQLEIEMLRVEHWSAEAATANKTIDILEEQLKVIQARVQQAEAETEVARGDARDERLSSSRASTAEAEAKNRADILEEQLKFAQEKLARAENDRDSARGEAREERERAYRAVVDKVTAAIPAEQHLNEQAEAS